MPLKSASFGSVRRKLIAAGFDEVSRRGSHVKFAKHDETGTRTAVVPHHREISLGTLRSILRQAGITVDKWDVL